MSFDIEYFEWVKQHKKLAIKIYPCGCFVSKNEFVVIVCDKHRRNEK
jgi:hypothetical protein